MLNPFLIAGAIFAAIGLLQEAAEIETPTAKAPKKIKNVSPQVAPVVIPAAKKVKEKVAPIVEPSDG